MSKTYPNTALIINKARNTITIDRDPNFDDMILVFDGVVAHSPFQLSPEKQVHVGSTYDADVSTSGGDMGLCFTYNSDERYMEVGSGQAVGLSSPQFQVISDSEDDGGGPLVYVPTDATDTSITLTFKDKS
ncbi:hypothetical protein [Granulicella mallensis]|uniref:Uncharacterized protein n=1 Tax=Granulicella mallensis TaxID=940614 RepID=A0A7W7ZMT8_9BACT|nr:hypothetical protein [Granulicella mallensis]MBB5062841.1 hypothetical protein [Granulicella mallensis]